MELTERYLDKKFDKIDERFKVSDDKFEELLQTVKVGFDACATKEDIRQVRLEITGLETRMNKKFEDIQFQINQLTEQVKEFVIQSRKNDAEFATLAVRCSELEKRVQYLEQQLSLQSGAAM